MSALTRAGRVWERRSGRRSLAGFTLVELLVVISILVLLLAVSVPAFRSLVRSSERSLAESLMTSGLRAARDAAYAQARGNDTAAVFYFDYEPRRGGRVTIVPCVLATTLRYEEDLGGTTRMVRRDVFVPIPELQPTQLPAGAMVRAYVPPGVVGAEWLDFPGVTNRYDDPRGDWVFPETSFFDAADNDLGERRHTFMVRFGGGTGELVTAANEPAIVVSPAAVRSTAWRRSQPFARADILNNVETLSRWAVDIAQTRRFSMQEQAEILGEQSPDTVLAMPVHVLAVFDERELAAALDVRVDPNTRTLLSFDGVDVSLAGGLGGSADINNWILGDSNRNDRVDADDSPSATVITFDRYTGRAVPTGIAPPAEGGA